MMDMKFTILAEVDATDLFDGDESNPNWVFCMGENETGESNVTFSHKSACEFILHIYGYENEDSHQKEKVRMRMAGCTLEFIKAYEEARIAGARSILFYA
jgi:hypothetical protein